LPSPAPFATPARQLRLPALWPAALALALAGAACEGEAASPGPGERRLVTDAATSATVGRDGGELLTSDPKRGVSYRVVIPAGAFVEDTAVTVTPIAAIGDFPLEGGLLGGVDLQPTGVTFLAPVSLEVRLDADGQAKVREGLANGQAVVGFEAAGSDGDLTATLVDVADDQSTVTLQLFGFSGHGAGLGTPQNLGSRPLPADPAKAAQLLINRILHPQGGPADPTDPAVRSQIKQVLKDWLDVLVVVIDSAVDDPAALTDAMSESLQWHYLAARYGFLSELWWGNGDEMSAEGQRLENAVLAAYLKALTAANEHCKTSTEIRRLDNLLALIDLHERAFLLGPGLLPELSLSNALSRGNFCLQFELTVDGRSQREIEEGASGQVVLRLDPHFDGLFSDVEAAKLQIEGTPAGWDASLITIGSVFFPGAEFDIDVTALKAISGSNSEGAFDFSLTMLGMTGYGSVRAVVDVTPAPATPPPPITCSGSPATIISINDEPENVAIVFDGGSSCRIVPDQGADNPDAMIVADTDPATILWEYEAAWNWDLDGGPKDNVSPGTYTLNLMYKPTGQWFSVTFTVDVTLINGGPDTTMTIRDATITSGLHV
jgi:hypothetical protein